MGDVKKELIELTTNLIRFKSVTNDSTEIDKCIKFIKTYMEGFHIEEITKNKVKSIVISKEKKRKFDYILLGHIDVVPAEPKMFIPKVTKEVIWGRGASDMKSGVAIAMLLMKNLQLENTALILTSDEELGGLNGAEHLANIYKANFVISLEPTDEKITMKKKGVVWIDLKCKGKSGHGSMPWTGINAAENIINAYNEIKQIFPKINKNSSKETKWQISCNLGMIKSGSYAYNKIPDFAEMGFDIRYTEKEDINKVIDKIRKIAKKHKCYIEKPGISPKVFTSPKNKYVVKLQKIGNFKLHHEFGSSDIRPFNAKGIPVVDFGPEEDGCHSHDERVYIDSMVSVYETLKKFFESE